MAKKLLHESSATPLTRKGSQWRAVYITPGEGSSGKYAAEMLSEFGGVAFPKGTKHFFKHPDNPGDQRDPRDQWGVTAEDAAFVEGEGTVGLIDVLPHWKDVVDSLAEAGQASLSIWAMGETDDEGNVLSLSADTSNTVDMVAFPGRPGSGLTTKMYESARALSDKARVEASAEKQENGKPMEEKLDKLIALFGTFVTESKTAAEAAVKAEADADAPEKVAAAAVEAYRVADKAITTAGLLESQVESLRTAAIAGADVAPLIESAKKIVAEFAALAESQAAPAGGRVVESGASDLDFEFSGYGVRK